MAEYIDRIAFRKHIDDFYPFNKEGQKDPKYDFAKGTFLKLLACFTQADVVERKTGKWFIDGNGTLRCSECKEEALLTLNAIEDVPFSTFSESHFCPKCGAKMIGGDEDV